MSRRSLIICFSALAAMVVMIVAAVAFLYNDDEGPAPVASRYALAHAVPPNAVMVCFLSEASEISSPLISSFGFPKELSEFFASGNSKGIAVRPMALSMHYSNRKKMNEYSVAKGLLIILNKGHINIEHL